jgi:uncharacterized Fe-S cluster-containing MiaB family protein
MSKGSSPRPFSVSQKEFANRFDRIFAKNKAKDIDDSALNVYNSSSTMKDPDERTLDGKVQTPDSQ